MENRPVEKKKIQWKKANQVNSQWKISMENCCNKSIQLENSFGIDILSNKMD